MQIVVGDVDELALRIPHEIPGNDVAQGAIRVHSYQIGPAQFAVHDSPHDLNVFIHGLGLRSWLLFGGTSSEKRTWSVLATRILGRRLSHHHHGNEEQSP